MASILAEGFRYETRVLRVAQVIYIYVYTDDDDSCDGRDA